MKHPITAKNVLFVNELWTKSIETLSQQEMKELVNVSKIPEIQVALEWSKGTVAIWDNYATQHYAVNDYYPLIRKMRRATIKNLCKL